MIRPTRPIALALSCALLWNTIPSVAQDAPPLVPRKVEASPAVRAVVDSPALSETERDLLRIFHGLHGEITEQSAGSPDLLLSLYDLHHPQFTDHSTPLDLRIRAALLRGDWRSVERFTPPNPTDEQRLWLAQAYSVGGRFDLATQALAHWQDVGRIQALTQPRDLVAAGRARVELAGLQASPAQEYHAALALYSRALDANRLYWPALIAQAELLINKDNPTQAVPALHEALRLNPRCSEAWYLLGRIAVNTFDFNSASLAAEKLRNIHPQHLLADMLDVEVFLTQKDPESASAVLASSLERFPAHPALRAFDAAVAALRYDELELQKALQRFDAVAPNHPLALFTAGKYLAMGRQYEEAQRLLRQALERQPNHADPRIELGLLLNQAGQDEAALAELRRAVELDPFHKRAINTLKLQEELAAYKQVESEHFIVRYRDEVDAALAADMPQQLEAHYQDLTALFGHEPTRKTLIEIMPDKRWFAIRITGMPWIWTIGACTGPVIAISPPRDGAHHVGHYDWSRVLRHEFVHTVTLSQTRNRIAHWFTEACAVSVEPAPRSYPTAQLLAEALASGELFNLEEINWAFVRPQRPNDRNLAYAQSHWMLEFITERHGRQAMLRMLDLSRQGIAQSQIIPQALGTTPDQFLQEFQQWAALQVRQWGLAPTPPAESLMKQLADAKPDPQTLLAKLLEEHPSHPDLLRLAGEFALDAGDDEASLALLTRYAAARPIDPWADRRIAELALKLNRAELAIHHLERLDLADGSSGSHARRLAELYRSQSQFSEALHAVERALQRTPYDASTRQFAATLALQAGSEARALHHLRAMTTLESAQPIHWTRLAALLHRMNQPDEANLAARRAKALAPDAPVDRFLKP